MTVTSYWMTLDNALALAEALEEDLHDGMAARVIEDSNDAYNDAFPDPTNARVVYASRFERDVMDAIDAYGIAHETRVVVANA